MMLRTLTLIALLVSGSALAQTAELLLQRQELANKYEAAYNAHDADAIAALFTDDAVVIPEGPMATGKPEIKERWARIFKQGFTEATIRVAQVHPLGDTTSWSVGQWWSKGPGANNTLATYHGQWASIDMKTGEEWKMRMLIYNIIEEPSNR